MILDKAIRPSINRQATIRAMMTTRAASSQRHRPPRADLVAFLATSRLTKRAPDAEESTRGCPPCAVTFTQEAERFAEYGTFIHTYYHHRGHAYSDLPALAHAHPQGHRREAECSRWVLRHFCHRLSLHALRQRIRVPH